MNATPPRFRRAPGIIETDLPDELILLDPASQEMFSLNVSGRAVWAAADGRTAEELAERVAAEFEVAPAQARDDVSAVLDELERAGLLLRIG